MYSVRLSVPSNLATRLPMQNSILRTTHFFLLAFVSHNVGVRLKYMLIGLLRLRRNSALGARHKFCIISENLKTQDSTSCRSRGYLASFEALGLDAQEEQRNER